MFVSVLGEKLFENAWYNLSFLKQIFNLFSFNIKTEGKIRLFYIP